MIKKKKNYKVTKSKRSSTTRFSSFSLSVNNNDDNLEISFLNQSDNFQNNFKLFN